MTKHSVGMADLRAEMALAQAEIKAHVDAVRASAVYHEHG